MTNVIDNAIAKLQDMSQACTSVAIKSAPDYPILNADPTPFSIAHIASGRGVAVNSSTLKFLPVVNVDFLFSLVNIKQTYQQTDAISLEYMQRLAGDPTLGGTVASIEFGDNMQPTFENVGNVTWGSVTLSLLRFVIPLKTLETPTT